MTGNIHQQRGFTLGEMLVAMAVVAISLSLAVPSYQNIVRNNRRVTAVNQLVSTLHIARSEAVTRNLQVTVCPSTDGASCSGGDWQDGWIFFPDADQDRAVDGDEPVLGAGNALQNLTVDTDEFPNFVAYRPNGRVMVNAPDENSGQFTFCDVRGAEHARVVVINPTGQPVLSTHQADGSDPECPDEA